MPYTTAEVIAGIIELDAAIPLDPFIETAHALVEECCTVTPAYTLARLELIERWLAAHFYAVRDPRTAQEGAAGITATYQGQTGMGLASTTYGQQALRLDTRGGLAALEKQAATGSVTGKAALFWLGRKC